MKDHIHSFSPETLNLYDTALWRKQVSQEEFLPLNIYAEFALAYSVHGDFTGVILAAPSKAVLEKNRIEKEEIFDIFQESMNLFLGHLLTQMERRQAILCEFQYPNLYQEKKLNVFYQKVSQSAQLHQSAEARGVFVKSRYALEMENKILPCQIEYFLYPCTKGEA